jgi:hypothetical protein
MGTGRHIHRRVFATFSKPAFDDRCVGTGEVKMVLLKTGFGLKKTMLV